MNAIMVILILDTIVQLVTCGFGIGFIISLICRGLFLMRIIGITIKIKGLLTGEVIAFIGVVLWQFIMHKGEIAWLKIGLTLLFAIIAVFLEWLDSLLYVYTIEDADKYE